MAKMGNKMIALCTAAIGAIYIAGYVVTEPAETALAQTSAPATATPQQDQTTQENANNSSTQTQSDSSTQSDQTAPADASNQQTSQSNQPTQSNQMKYKDGTYSGSGTNRFGTVEVAVTIKQGKIANVHITNCTTHYPQSFIDPQLPNAVMQAQSANVDTVSGATRSSEDFLNAVQEALQQAQA